MPRLRYLGLTLASLFVLPLVLAACGGDSNDSAGSTPAEGESATNTSSDSTTGPGGETTSGSTATTGGGEPSNGTPKAGNTSSPTEPVATPTQIPPPTPNAEAVKAFTNGLVGEAQQPLFYMRFIVGDVECTANCDESIEVKWNRVARACQQGRWESHRQENGYDESIHGPLVKALIDSCGIVLAKLATGTPAETDDWAEEGNRAYNILSVEFDALSAAE